MKVLIIGLGSIAKKHIHALQSLQKEIHFTALRNSNKSPSYEQVTDVFSLEAVDLQSFDFFLISSPTHLHFRHLEQLLPLNKPIFLEKPPIFQLEHREALSTLFQAHSSLVYTAYNMRFHPAIQWLNDFSRRENILEINAYCGSYLPHWRPETDYRTHYSAHKQQGGGVHLDVIHELDYLVWIFGIPEQYTTQLAKVSDLEINSVDSAVYWLGYSDLIINITLNYYRKVPKRTVEVVTEDAVYTINLLDSTVYKDGEPYQTFQSGIPETYVQQMKYFLALIQGKAPLMTSFGDALDLLNIALNE